MRSYLLSEYIKALHLRQDAPMPSEVKEAHDKINALRARHASRPSARILQFSRHNPAQ